MFTETGRRTSQITTTFTSNLTRQQRSELVARSCTSNQVPYTGFLRMQRTKTMSYQEEESQVANTFTKSYANDTE